MAEAATPTRDVNTDEVLQREYRGPTAVLTLNRPDALNAINTTMVTELRDYFGGLAENRTVRVVVLRPEQRKMEALRKIGCKKA